MLRCLLCLLLAVAIAPPAAAHSHKRKHLVIVHPWTFETGQKETTTTARVFMTIRNSGRASDRLVSASTTRAEKVELAAGDAAAEGGSPAGFTVDAGQALVLYPRGPHLLLTGVKKAFHAYDDFKMTLVFEKAGRVVIDVVVEEAGEDHQH
jgi:periplasmic copper chaperone A